MNIPEFRHKDLSLIITQGWLFSVEDILGRSGCMALLYFAVRDLYPDGTSQSDWQRLAPQINPLYNCIYGNYAQTSSIDYIYFEYMRRGLDEMYQRKPERVALRIGRTWWCISNNIIKYSSAYMQLQSILGPSIIDQLARMSYKNDGIQSSSKEAFFQAQYERRWLVYHCFCKC